MGRPTKLTPELQKRLTDAVRAGNYYEAACAYAGVDYTTFRLWMRQGEEAESGPFSEFFNAVRKAEADAETAVVAQWRQQIPDNWQAARDFLARRFPDRWGQRDTLTVLQKLAAQVQGMSDEDLLTLGDGGGADRPETVDASGSQAAGPDTPGAGAGETNPPPP